MTNNLARGVDMANATCSIDGCERARFCRGWCPTHYQRWRQHGDPGPADLFRQPNSGDCSVEGCDQPMRKRGWCAGHYAQWRRYGEFKPFAYKWGDGGYSPAHGSLARTLGKASTKTCADCGDPAQEWSYVGGDPAEWIDPVRGAAFSRDPAFYEPRCVRCHRIYDANPIAMRATALDRAERRADRDD